MNRSIQRDVTPVFLLSSLHAFRCLLEPLFCIVSVANSNICFVFFIVNFMTGWHLHGWLPLLPCDGVAVKNIDFVVGAERHHTPQQSPFVCVVTGRVKINNEHLLSLWLPLLAAGNLKVDYLDNHIYNSLWSVRGNMEVHIVLTCVMVQLWKYSSFYSNITQSHSSYFQLT